MTNKLKAYVSPKSANRNIHRWGHFHLDTGSTNGYLFERLYSWTCNTIMHMNFYGLEISKELTELSKRLWPHLKNNFFNGNALAWRPDRKFDYVYTMIIPDLPHNLRADFMSILMRRYVKESGRLILGEFKTYELEKEIHEMGYIVSGYCEKRMSENRIRKMIWIDNG